jgi:hypothetical protein
MRRWVPFAIAVFMLTPFALWAGFSLGGLGGGLANLVTAPEGMVLSLASVPLAGLFWIQNLRQIGDSIGGASRWRGAERVAQAMPWLVFGIGVTGCLWMASVGVTLATIALTTLCVLAMAGFGLLAARAPASPMQNASPTKALSHEAGEESAEAFLWFVFNAVAVTAVLCFVWTPLVVLWVAVGLVPVVFAVLVSVAAWGCRHA